MKTILVVDDVAAFRQLARTVLSFDRYNVLEADNGPAAVALAALTPPDLVLMDIWMPGAYDGHEACRRLREMPGLADLPVIMLTSSDDQETRVRSRTVGACGHLLKPFRPNELLSILQEHLKPG